MLFTEIKIHSPKMLTLSTFLCLHREDAGAQRSKLLLFLANRHWGAAGKVQLIACAAGVDGDLEVIGAPKQRAHFAGCGLHVGGDDPADAMCGGRNLDAVCVYEFVE